jgi:hypothetical protein
LHSFDRRHEIACEHDVRVNESKKVGTGGMFHCFEEMTDQRGSERGSVDGRNLTKAKLFTTLPHPGFITENNDLASRAKGPTAKGVALDTGSLPFERLTGSKEG